MLFTVPMTTSLPDRLRSILGEPLFWQMKMVNQDQTRHKLHRWSRPMRDEVEMAALALALPHEERTAIVQQAWKHLARDETYAQQIGMAESHAFP